MAQHMTGRFLLMLEITQSRRCNKAANYLRRGGLVPLSQHFNSAFRQLKSQSAARPQLGSGLKMTGFAAEGNNRIVRQGNGCCDLPFNIRGVKPAHLKKWQAGTTRGRRHFSSLPVFKMIFYKTCRPETRNPEAQLQACLAALRIIAGSGPVSADG